MPKAYKDLLAGLAFIGFGAAFAYASLGYGLGSPLRLGPGAFPLLLAGVLALLGIIIIVQGVLLGGEDELGPFPWRGAIFLLSALLFFGLTVRGLGLVPSLFGAIFLTGLASSRNGPLMALLLAAALTLFCVVIFIYGLGVPIRLFGPWLPL